MRANLFLGLLTLPLTVLGVPADVSTRGMAASSGFTAPAALAAPALLVGRVEVASYAVEEVTDWPAPDPFEGLPSAGPAEGPVDVPGDATPPAVPHEPVAEPVPVAWVQVGPPSITENDAIVNAKSLLGVPYLWGGNSSAGMDCSAYVSRAWGVPRQTTDTLYRVASPIAKEDLQPGDAMNLTKSEDPRGYGHVRMFAAWATTDHSRVWVYEETPRESIFHVIAYDSRYTPMRRANIVSDGTPAPLVPAPVSNQSTTERTARTRTPSATSTQGIAPGATSTPRSATSRSGVSTPTPRATPTSTAIPTILRGATPTPRPAPPTPRAATPTPPPATPTFIRPTPTPPAPTRAAQVASTPTAPPRLLATPTPVRRGTRTPPPR